MKSVTHDIVAILRDLVSFDTQNPPGKEITLVNYCGTFLEDLGFDVKIFPYSLDRANLVASWFPRGNIEREIQQVVFSGHADTVPIGDPESWHSPPLQLTERDGNLIGRGACDMKGSIAAFLAVAQDVARDATIAGPLSDCPFSIILTADEEVGFSGIRSLLQPFPLSHVRGIIIGEPTGNIPVMGHKGVLWFRVTFHGKSAHASRPDCGENAILMATKFCERLMVEYETTWRQIRHSLLGNPTINIGKIAGGIKPNMVPDTCEVWLDCRTVPPLDLPSMQYQIEVLAHQVAQNVTIFADPAPGDPYSLPPSDPFAQIVLKTTQTERPGIYSAFTEAPSYYQALGVPVVILGPGVIEQAHAADEHIPRTELEAAVRIYEQFLKNITKL